METQTTDFIKKAISNQQIHWKLERCEYNAGKIHLRLLYFVALPVLLFIVALLFDLTAYTDYLFWFILFEFAVYICIVNFYNTKIKKLKKMLKK